MKKPEQFNTGPKGVLEDFNRYNDTMRLQKEESKVELINRIKKQSMALSSTKIETRTLFCDSALDDDTEEERIKAIRRKERMSEFLQNNHIMKYEGSSGQQIKARTYGEMDYLGSRDQFLEIVESDENVIVHLSHQSETNFWDRCLQKVAIDSPLIHFCSIPALELDQQFDIQVALPAILCYRSGNLVGNLIRFTDYIDEFSGKDDLSQEDVDDYTDIIKDILLDYGNMVIQK